jgi:outer membrane protein OmpA-like peptidoglycan-associated protein
MSWTIVPLFFLVLGCTSTPRPTPEELQLAQAEIRGLKEELRKAENELAYAYHSAGEFVLNPMGATPFARLSEFRIAIPVAFFSPGSATLEERYRQGLEEFATSVRPHAEFKLAVVGYADAQGSESANDALGFQRAQAVAAALLSEGIEAGRMTVESMGEMFGETTDRAERQLERRVVILLSVEPGE